MWVVLKLANPINRPPSRPIVVDDDEGGPSHLPEYSFSHEMSAMVTALTHVVSGQTSSTTSSSSAAGHKKLRLDQHHQFSEHHHHRPTLFYQGAVPFINITSSTLLINNLQIKLY